MEAVGQVSPIRLIIESCNAGIRAACKLKHVRDYDCLTAPVSNVLVTCRVGMPAT